MPNKNPIGFPPPPIPPQAFNITRNKPISTSTQQTNSAYQQALKSLGTGVWQFYQLVATQWPVPSNTPANPGSIKFSFPGAGVTTAFANTTMETFDQKSVQTSCMNCHNAANAGPNTDFLWALQMHAFPGAVGADFGKIKTLQSRPKAPLSVPLKNLKKMLQTINEK
jgi:hypothetical protein